MTATRWRKRPVVIEAIQWNGNNLTEVIAFTGWHESASSRWSWEEYVRVVSEHGLKIFTLEGPMLASIGDWIIKGVKGEFYPCKPDVFAATYEPADGGDALPTCPRCNRREPRLDYCAGCDREECAE